MKIAEAVPFEGIGNLKLGMTREEILENVKLLLKELGIPEESLKVARDYCLTGGYTRYFADDIFLLASFDEDDRAVEICADKECCKNLKVYLYNMDVFNTPFTGLITELKKKSALVTDLDDEDLSYNYEFTDIGIRLWRDGVFHPKLLKDEAYMEKMGDILDEEKEYLFFNIIGVKAK